MLTVIAAVHDGPLQRLFLRQLLKDRLKARGIVALATGEDERHAGSVVDRARMDCGGPSTPRASQSLGRLAAVFFNAPAAC
jgi:hypothetical protein